MNYYLPLINRAKELLLENPYDNYHTLEHHYAVLENIHNIWIEDGLDVDPELVEIAVWWHDVFKGNEDELELLNLEFSRYLDKEIKFRLIKIINEHSFGKSQTTNESKLLYDADKIELFSITRWKTVFDMFEYDQISLEERDKYIKEWNRRLPFLINKLHFKSSNQYLDTKYKLFIKWLDSINRYESNLFV